MWLFGEREIGSKSSNSGLVSGGKGMSGWWEDEGGGGALSKCRRQLW